MTSSRVLAWLPLAVVMILSSACSQSSSSCGPGNCSGCCNGSGVCEPGTTASACGGGGGTCSGCSSQQTCSAGMCISSQGGCGPSNCANGCCAPNGTCIAPSNTGAACGKAGGTCNVCSSSQSCVNGACSGSSGCSAANCNGCCDGSGNCVTNETVSQCGSGGAGSACTACGGGQSCTGGACVTNTTDGGTCGPSNCSGCCDTANNTCVTTESNSQCGSATTAGSACVACTGASTCSAGVCSVPNMDGGFDAGPPCGPGTCAGCCDTNTNACITSMTNAQCGTEYPGENCIACLNGSVCQNGVCATSGTTGTPAIPTIGCVATTYQAPMKIGSGSKLFRMIVDTGSTDMGVAASNCTECVDGGVELTYGDTGTNTGQTDQTQFADGSGWSGPVYTDNVGMVGIAADMVSVNFAAISTESGFFNAQDCSGNVVPFAVNQGIVGMGPTDLLGTGTTSYFNQLASGTVPNIFAVQMCLGTGTIWLGGFDSSAVSAQPQYSAIVAGQYEQVNLKSASFNGTSLGGTTNPSVIDTGTYGIGLPTTAYNALQSAVQGNATFNTLLGNPDAGFFTGTECLSTTGGQTMAEVNQMLPTMGFTFAGNGASSFTITSPATQSYLFVIDTGIANGGLFYCWGAFDMGASGSLLGDTFMQNQVTVFDLANNRIGFAPAATCPALPSFLRRNLGERPPPIHVTVRNPHRRPSP